MLLNLSKNGFRTSHLLCHDSMEATKVYDVAAKFWTMTIIARKCCAEMWTNSTGGADVPGPA